MPELPHYDIRLTAPQVNAIATALGYLPLNAERQLGTVATIQQQVLEQEQRAAAAPEPPAFDRPDEGDHPV